MHATSVCHGCQVGEDSQKVSPRDRHTEYRSQPLALNHFSWRRGIRSFQPLHEIRELDLMLHMNVRHRNLYHALLEARYPIGARECCKSLRYRFTQTFCCDFDRVSYRAKSLRGKVRGKVIFARLIQDWADDHP